MALRYIRRVLGVLLLASFCEVFVTSEDLIIIWKRTPNGSRSLPNRGKAKSLDYGRNHGKIKSGYHFDGNDLHAPVDDSLDDLSGEVISRSAFEDKRALENKFARRGFELYGSNRRSVDQLSLAEQEYISARKALALGRSEIDVQRQDQQFQLDMADLVEQNCGTNLTEKRNFDICGVMSQLRMINDLLDERSTLGKRLSSKNLLRLDEVLSVDITMYLAEKIRELTKENGKLRHAKLVKSPVYTLKDAGKCEGKKHLESGEKGRLRDDENGGVYNTRKYSGQNSVILRFGKENRGDEGDKDNFQDEFAFPIDDVE